MEMLFAAIAFTYSFSIADFEVYEKRTALPIQDDLSQILESRQQLKMIETNSKGGGGGGGDLQSTLFAAEQNMGGRVSYLLISGPLSSCYHSSSRRWVCLLKG
jgi:hypothetical protein